MGSKYTPSKILQFWIASRKIIQFQKSSTRWGELSLFHFSALDIATDVKLYLYALSNEQFIRRDISQIISGYRNYQKIRNNKRVLNNTLQHTIRHDIKWKTLTLSCNCPLVTSFLIYWYRGALDHILPFPLLHTLYSSTTSKYICVSMRKGAYHIFMSRAQKHSFTLRHGMFF